MWLEGRLRHSGEVCIKSVKGNTKCHRVVTMVTGVTSW